MTFPQRCSGKTVLVTGAGTGFGAEIAVRAAQEGARVAVHYNRSAAGAERTVSRIRQAGSDGFTVQADIVRRHDIVRMVEEVFGRFGSLDVLVITSVMSRQSRCRGAI